MSRVLLVADDVTWALPMAAWWAATEAVDVVLLDGAAATARATHPDAPALRSALEAGVTIAVHDEAAARRGLTAADRLDGVKSVNLDEVADLIADTDGAVMWL